MAPDVGRCWNNTRKASRRASAATFPPSSHLPGTTADRQGGFRATHNPGLKPWAIVYSRFAATIRPPQLDENYNFQNSDYGYAGIWSANCSNRGSFRMGSQNGSSLKVALLPKELAGVLAKIANSRNA